VNRTALLENRSTADESYPGNEALDNPRRSLRGVYEKRFGRLDKSTTREGNERKGTQTGAACFLLAIQPIGNANA
jgi:hypothetical protein